MFVFIFLLVSATIVALLAIIEAPSYHPQQTAIAAVLAIFILKLIKPQVVQHTETHMDMPTELCIHAKIHVSRSNGWSFSGKDILKIFTPH